MKLPWGMAPRIHDAPREEQELKKQTRPAGDAGGADQFRSRR